MAINKKLIHFKNKATFEEKLANNEILNTSIVFIKDAKLIYTHEQYYDCSETDLSDYPTLDEVNTILESYAKTEDVPTKLSDLADDVISGNYLEVPSGDGTKYLADDGTYKTISILEAETDPIFNASAAANITTSDISNWNSKTSNTGTITGITMNGTSKGTSGVVNLGTVITEHQDISGKLDSSTAASTYLSKTDAENTYLGKDEKAASATISDAAVKASQDGSGNVIVNTYATKSELSNTLTEANLYTDDAIGTLVGTAPETLDTIHELATAVSSNQEIIDNIESAITNKVDKVSGKGLSTNDYTTAEKNKLAGIASGAEVNVQSDWSVTDSTSDTYIKNKPTIPTVPSSLKNPYSLTIQKNGTTVTNGTYDGSAAKTVNITVPTKVSELTNDSGYKTTDTNTTYTFAGGTNKFTVTPSGGNAQTVTVTPSISNNVTYSGTLTSGQVAVYDGTAGKIKASGYTIASSVPSGAKFTDTTYSAATTSAAGLMSAADKTKLNGIATGATANTGTVTSVATGVGLTGGTISTSGTVKAKLRSETALTVNSAAATTTSGRVYPVAVDKTGYLAVNVPWTDTNTTYSFSNNNPTLAWGTKSTIGTVGGTALTVTMPANPNTDTHYTTGINAGASGAVANSAVTNPYVTVKDNSTYRGQIRLVGGGATTVKSDASGNITISSTDTNTNTTYSAGTGLTLSSTTFNVGAGPGISVTADTVAVASELYSRGSATTAATAGWYRIATSAVNIGNCQGIFQITAVIAGKHTTAVIAAGTSYGIPNSSNISVLQCSHFSTSALTKVRIVYHTTYSNNYAYLEVYNPFDVALPIAIKMLGGTGWTLVAPSTAGSIPSGYSNKEVTLSNGTIYSEKFSGNGSGLTSVNAASVDGYSVSKVSTMPTSPDANTIYFVV